MGVGGKEYRTVMEGAEMSKESVLIVGYLEKPL
jgi:hypothetical protein